jgi:hypothetical protein
VVQVLVKRLQWKSPQFVTTRGELPRGGRAQKTPAHLPAAYRAGLYNRLPRAWKSQQLISTDYGIGSDARGRRLYNLAR